MNIYVGNLSFEVTDDDLRQLSTTYDEVESASVVKDRFSGKSGGFGFVEMPAPKRRLLLSTVQTPKAGPLRSMRLNRTLRRAAAVARAVHENWAALAQQNKRSLHSRAGQ